MPDLITHVPDLAAFIAEGKTIATMPDDPRAQLFLVDDGGESLTFSATKIPVHYAADGQTLCVCRGVPREMIDACQSIDVLGEVVGAEYRFDSPATQAVYEQARGPLDAGTDQDGNPIIRPYKIGVFLT
ncbi:hypothetical protein KUW19_00255 [Ferrimonas balearica]|uniref:hypothetical protein n=1 Tax=Ferrimonas balearica TaxID=44012 RepID=UPI001C975424|nr:hypothetical protein [Ferrimonas balearica]MBY6104913.1 hypothetical protein [Ferrimonas balearica]